LMAKGCLRALGVTDAELEKIEQTWLAQSDTAMFVVSSFDPRPTLGITLAQYRGLEKIAQRRSVDVARMNNTLWLQSLGDVMQSHVHDTVINEEQLRKETNARLLIKIDELIAK
jgi:hypothetical protein